MEFKSFQLEKKSSIEAELERLLSVPATDYEVLLEAARHAVLVPAKRLRPLLVLAIVRALGGDEAIALTPACAIELVHSYSLVHDDLPCMDDDDLRRGLPTVHKQFGQANAVLAGDYLLTYAFEVITTSNNISDAIKVELVRILSSRSGGEGMIGGQIMDINITEDSLALLERRHWLKTGSLITACAEFGAVLSGADSEMKAGLIAYAKDLGLAFQVIDDILDVIGNTQEMGKPAGSDDENSLITFVTVLGVERAKEYAFELAERAVGHLTRIRLHDQVLEEIAGFVVERSK